MLILTRRRDESVREEKILNTWNEKYKNFMIHGQILLCDVPIKTLLAIDMEKEGIAICEEWRNSFIEFYNWSINNGYSDDLSIDRINNNGNYEPSNSDG